MAGLRPAFRKDGTVTAGNASGINDAAAAGAGGEASPRSAGLPGHPAGYSLAAVDPAIMGIGPAPAVRQLLDRTGVAQADVDVWEANEAFAAQALAVVKELGWTRKRSIPTAPASAWAIPSVPRGTAHRQGAVRTRAHTVTLRGGDHARRRPGYCRAVRARRLSWPWAAAGRAVAPGRLRPRSS